MSYRKKIKIFFQDGVSQKQYDYAESATCILLDHAQVSYRVFVEMGDEIDNLDAFRRQKYGKFKGILNGDRIIKALERKRKMEIDNDEEDYYSILLIDEQLFFKRNGKLHFVGGLASNRGVGIVCLTRGENEDEKRYKKRIQLMMIHEYGHMFDVFKIGREEKTLTYSFGDSMHCAYYCAMYPSISIVVDRLELKKMPLCILCLDGVKSHFIE